ncbi:hypothetical protein [Mesorhizobium sp.]|uniref:hypothetical protein n=1 Tax=Mesorhizobium sp. TaxID=1871066 RepID=UPI0025C6539F|nr:hypothetical protein [Mesorhizobium sp.]
MVDLFNSKLNMKSRRIRLADIRQASPLINAYWCASRPPPLRVTKVLWHGEGDNYAALHGQVVMQGVVDICVALFLYGVGGTPHCAVIANANGH